MKWLRTLIARSPKPFLIAGKIIFLLGAILIVAAIFVRGGMTGIPTWLVLQGPIGFGIAAVLVLFGMTLTVLAEEVLKPKQRKPW